MWYVLTPCNTTLIQQLIVAQIVNKFLFYVTGKFIAVFTRDSSRCNVVGIATRVRGGRFGVRSPVWARHLMFSEKSSTALGAHSASRLSQ
jgi:hypothetical protein